MCGKKGFFLAFNIFFTFLFLGLFAFLFAKIWSQFAAKRAHFETNVYKDEKLQSFPKLTFCSAKAFKSKGFFHTKNDFKQSSYTLVSIFIHFYTILWDFCALDSGTNEILPSDAIGPPFAAFIEETRIELVFILFTVLIWSFTTFECPQQLPQYTFHTVT